MRSFYHISVMIARGISESVMIAGRISQSSCRSRLSPPLWCPAGGACPVGRLPTLPLACCLAPYPPTPLPHRGRGCPKVYFAGGFAPGTPALNRLRHLQSLPCGHPAGGLAPGGIGSTRRCGARRGAFPRRHWLSPPLWCPEGAEPARHLLSLPRGRGPSQTPKFLSPGPPSPWLPALLIGKPFCWFYTKPQAPLRWEPVRQAL